VIEVGAWALAAVFFAVVCVVVWFFLKLFFRLALVVIAVSFFIAFLYQYSLLPEPFSKQVEEVISKAKDIIQERVEEKVSPKKKKESQRRAEYTHADACDFVFC
jgi:hypothetical protein